MKGERRYKKGLWTDEEDRTLTEYIRVHGKGKWNRIAQMTGLKRSGKSCRLRWVNYLSPTVKHGNFSEEEDDLIIRLHNLLGNRWSLIAGRVPGRTDNQIKNHWNTHLSKKLRMREEIIRSKVGGSSQELTTFVVAENVNVPMVDANWKLPSNNNVGTIEEEKVVEEGSQNKLVGFCEVEEEARVNESLESPFFLFSNFNTPLILELLDQYYSLDDQFV